MADLLSTGSGVGREELLAMIRDLQRDVNFLMRQVQVSEPEFDLAYEIVWTAGYIEVGYSPYYPLPFDCTLYETIYTLTTPSTGTGIHVYSYQDGTAISNDTFAAGEPVNRQTGLDVHFSAEQSFFQFRVSSVGDATSAGLTAVARFHR